jgi:hypothetical protein
MEYAEEAAATFDRDAQAGSGDTPMGIREVLQESKSPARKVS